MEKSEYIEWKKEYDSGIVMVDRQHRILVDLINNLKEAHNNKTETSVLRETILKLVDYTKFHFGFEEKHMTQFGYHKLSSHKQLHQTFIDQVIEILEHLKKGNYENLSDEILSFLTNWLIDHILKQDRDYAHFHKMRKKYI